MSASWDTGRVPGDRARARDRPPDRATRRTRCSPGSRRSCSSRSGTRPSAPTSSPRCSSPVPPRSRPSPRSSSRAGPASASWRASRSPSCRSRGGSVSAPIRMRFTCSSSRSSSCCSSSGAVASESHPATRSATGPACRPARLWLVAASVAFGLALGNHALTLLLVPAIAVFVLLVEPRILWRRWRLVLACAATIALVTVVVYAYIPLRSSMGPPLDYAMPQTLGTLPVPRARPAVPGHVPHPAALRGDRRATRGQRS